MRALRIPLPAAVPTEPTSVPAWIIDGERRSEDDHRDAPRLEVPRAPPGERAVPSDRQGADAVPLPGSTVIVIPL